jgi:hypothetical protein
MNLIKNRLLGIGFGLLKIVLFTRYFPQAKADSLIEKS